MDIIAKSLYSPNRMFQSQHVAHVSYAVIAALVLDIFGVAVQPLSAQENAEKYEIKIIRGANLVNSVKRRVATEPIVEVQDRNKKPVGAVILTFTLPDTGPSGTFVSNGSKIATAVTGPDGRATMPPFQSNDQAGSYNVNVSGSVNGVIFSTLIAISNKSAPFAHSTALKVSIFVAAATAIAAGVAVGRGGSSKTTVTPGTPTIGPASAGSKR